MAMEYAKAIPGEEAARFLRGMINSGKQVQKNCVDLTCKQVYILEGPGSLDFGGSEFEMAAKKKHPKVKRRAEDKYGWWELGGGMYVFEYNEELELPVGKMAIVYPRAELLGNEASHPTMVLNGGEPLPAMCLHVGPPGLRIKENARISRLAVIG